jgi:hypothetical protein
MKRSNIGWAGLVLWAGVWVGWAGREAPPPDPSPTWLNENIPFGMEVFSTPPDGCDALDVALLITRDADGREINQRWHVMDGEEVQLACPTFEDLYYRCEAPGCYNLRIVTVDARSGNILSTALRHVCLH